MNEQISGGWEAMMLSFLNTLNLFMAAFDAPSVVLGFRIHGHLVVEAILVVALIYLFFQKSYKPPKRPLTEKEIDELCAEWVPEPLHPPITADMLYEPPVLESAAGPHTIVGGKEVVNFASANYLGLVGHEKIIGSCMAALEKYGVGSCGPRGFYGTIDVHLDCEEKIAKFLGTPDSVLYSYGLSTIFSVIPAFAKKGDLILVDEGVHWGIQNGLSLSRSTVVPFKHNDMESLKGHLERVTRENKRLKKIRRYIVVEAIYQNSGQMAPLDEIIRLKEKYLFRVILDESNSVGVLGRSGRGLSEHYNIPRLSSSGYVFSASLPPYLASAAITSIGVLEENPDLLTKLKDNISILREGLLEIPGITITSHQLSPLVFLKLRKSIGSLKDDLVLLEAINDKMLKEENILLSAPKRSTLDNCKLPCGVRICVSAGHSQDDVLKLAMSLKRVAASIFAEI
ncbi:long chain base biosynthesis protein 1 isoform X2 [Amborella trichopoda]|uniref:long chain base biosynthesis protein 1 isoform X2 n=1 Tax=Amborella trichopoda TaxID=13333 RepID=UPI0009BF5DB6|nr:long chain base biosynthesis protein 1 isoform X2 [Amborella trichopoda]|eukprot:XP_020525615.1 long chain base biosynthesis protein 1 isoform X2 [Amborella trichopoda]